MPAYVVAISPLLFIQPAFWCHKNCLVFVTKNERQSKSRDTPLMRKSSAPSASGRIGARRFSAGDISLTLASPALLL